MQPYQQRERVECEASHYWAQYYSDGEHDSLLV